MAFSRELLFFFSALGAFNGLVIGLYFLFVAKPRHLSNYFLGTLLLALSIRIGKSVFFYFNTDLAGIFLQIGMSGCVFIGPSLYFYLKSVTQPEKKHNEWRYHYLILFVAIMILNVSYSWDDFPHVWHYTFHVIYAEWLIYLVLAGIQIKSMFSKILKKGEKMTGMEVWVVSIYLGNFLIWTAYNLANYTSYIVGALTFSFIFYLLILLLFFSRRKDPDFLSRQVKYANKKIDPSEAEALTEQLDQLLRKEALYKNANIKLPEVASRLHVLPHRLSQLINDNLDKNFTLLINEYRIEEAKQLIESDTHLKLESIGYECGFNAKSTFYSAFRKHTGTTPAKYQERLAN